MASMNIVWMNSSCLKMQRASPPQPLAPAAASFFPRRNSLTFVSFSSKSGIEGVGKSADDLLRKGQDAVTEGLDSAKNTAEELKERAESDSKDLSAKAEKAAGDAWKSAEEGAGETKEKVKGAAEWAEEKAKEGTGKAVETTESLGEAVKDSVQGAWDAVKGGNK